MSIPNVPLPMHLEELRMSLYNPDILSIDPTKLVPWTKSMASNIDPFLENIYKLSCIGKRLEHYAGSDSFFKAYNDTNQVVRAYIKETYVVLELNPNPKDNNKWTHIVEHHSPNNKKGKNFYTFNVPYNINQELIDKLTDISSMIVDTVEQYLLDIINDKKTVMDTLYKIRILDKTESEIIDEEKIRLKAQKEFKESEKMSKREIPFWSKFFPDNKVTFM